MYGPCLFFFGAGEILNNNKIEKYNLSGCTVHVSSLPAKHRGMFCTLLLCCKKILVILNTPHHVEHCLGDLKVFWPLNLGCA